MKLALVDASVNAALAHDGTGLGRRGPSSALPMERVSILVTEPDWSENPLDRNRAHSGVS